MADEPENHTLAILREMRTEMKERFDNLQAVVDSVQAVVASVKDEVAAVRADLAMHRIETKRDVGTLAISSLDTLQAIRQLRKHLNLADA